jgi:hypothetical protein
MLSSHPNLLPSFISTAGYQYPKQIIARCGNFAPYNASISNAYIPGALPFFPSSSSALNLTVYGFVEVRSMGASQGCL